LGLTVVLGVNVFLTAAFLVVTAAFLVGCVVGVFVD